MITSKDVGIAIVSGVLIAAVSLIVTAIRKRAEERD